MCTSYYLCTLFLVWYMRTNSFKLLLPCNHLRQAIELLASCMGVSHGSTGAHAGSPSSEGVERCTLTRSEECLCQSYVNHGFTLTQTQIAPHKVSVGAVINQIMVTAVVVCAVSRGLPELGKKNEFEYGGFSSPGEHDINGWWLLRILRCLHSGHFLEGCWASL